MKHGYWFRAGLAAVALAALQPGLARAYVDTRDLYLVGDTRDGPVALSWTHSYDFSGIAGTDAYLIIDVEGVDLGELDEVSFNGEVLGNLAQQTFYNETYEYTPGAGGLTDKTEVVPSYFVIPVSKLQASNTVSIEVDDSGGGYILEVERSQLLVESPIPVVPEPSTWAQLAAGLSGLCWLVRRRRPHS